MEAIILAGGLGTRIQPVLRNLPKVMAPIGNRPFIAHLLDDLKTGGVTHAVLALGYKADYIIDYISSHPDSMKVSFSVEQHPLGTGGAIREAIKRTSEKNVFVLNGDTRFHIDYVQMMTTHCQLNPDITMAVRKVREASRYGRVKILNQRITAFEEKGSPGAGYVNGGIYILNHRVANYFPRADAFSFELDWLEACIEDTMIVPFKSDGYFIDIGTPRSYQKAISDFERETL